MSIGKNIATFRKDKGMTQAELGGMLNVTNQAVSKWEAEASMPDVMLLPKIAKALDVTLEELYEGREEQLEQPTQPQEPSQDQTTVAPAEKRVFRITVDDEDSVKIRMPVEAARFFMCQGDNAAETQAWEAMLSKDGVLVDLEEAGGTHVKIEVVTDENDGV